MHLQHCRQRVGRSSTFLGGLGVMGLAQGDQSIPRIDRPDGGQKVLRLGLLPGRGRLVVRETKLLAADHPCSDPRSQGHCPADRLGFQNPVGPRQSAFFLMQQRKVCHRLPVFMVSLVIVE